MDPNLIHYACIAKGTLVLAEFNSRDAALGSIAAKCLEKTPSFHATFTHTVQSRTYTFLIDGRFVYFAIFDEDMESSEGFLFLKSVRDAFCEFYRGEKRLERLRSHCFQGEFNPVFRRVLGLGFDHMDGMSSPIGHRMSDSGMLQYESSPIIWQNGETGVSRMKNRVLAGFINIGRRNYEKKEIKGKGLGRDYMEKSGGLYSASESSTGHQRSKKAWYKEVCVILCVDLVICLTLFLIWLWICGGFRCINA